MKHGSKGKRKADTSVEIMFHHLLPHPNYNTKGISGRKQTTCTEGAENVN